MVVEKHKPKQQDFSSTNIYSVVSEDDKMQKGVSGANPLPGGRDINAEYSTDVYNFNCPNRGTAIIINNTKFNPLTRQDDRKGADNDAQNMQDTFKFLGFNVKTFTNLTTTQMLKVLQSVASEDHTNNDCLVCCICSHGDQNVQGPGSSSQKYRVSDLVYGVDGVLYIRLITELFKDDKCPSLAGKPKLFFIQACRGQELSETVEVSDGGDEQDAVDGDYVLTQEVPIYKDALLAYSAPPGFYSFRRGSGSWFITSLCQMLQMYSTELDLMSLLTKVNYQVAVQFESNTPSRPMMHKRHVVPWIASMLTKEVWFKPKDNDERRVVFV